MLHRMNVLEIISFFIIAFVGFVTAVDVPQVTPQGYFLEVFPDFDKEIVTTFVHINVATYPEPSNVIELDSDPTLNLNNNHIKVFELTNRPQNGKSKRNMNITAVERDLKEPNKLKVHVQDKLQKDVIYQVQFSVEDSIANVSKTGPFYMRKILDTASNEERKYFAMDLQNHGCFKAFPCFNNPEYRIWINVTIVRKPSFTSLSTAQINYTTESSDDYVKDHFVSTPLMSINSLAIVVTDVKMDAVDFSEADLNARISNRTGPAVWTYPKLIKSTLTSFENLFSVRYPLPSLRVLVVQEETNIPSLHAFGLIVTKLHAHSMPDLFLNRVLRSIFAQWTKQVTTSIDDTHIWEYYYHLIWNDILRDIKKEFGFKPDRSVNWQFFFVTDALSLEEKRQLDYFSFNMLNDLIGNNVFNEGMNIFLQKQEFKTYTKLDFWNAMDEAVKRHGKFESLNKVERLSLITDSWNSTHLPLVTVYRGESKDKINLTQENLVYGSTVYDMKKLTDNMTAEYKPHWIPIAIGQPRNISNQPKLSFWLTQENHVFTLSNINSSDFILVNPGYVAPFIVNYEPADWNMLVKNFKAMPVNVTIQLLCDSLLLAHIDRIDYTIFLNMSASLVAENSYLPAWNQYVINFVPSFRRVLHGHVLQKYNEFLRRQLVSVMKLNNTDSWYDLKVTACSLNASNCYTPHDYETLLNEAKTGKRLTGKYNCRIMANVSLFDWQLIANGIFQALGKQNKDYKSDALYVLTCTDNPLAIEALLNIVFLNFNQSELTINEHHQDLILYDFGRHPEEKTIALLNFTSKNFKQLKERLSPRIWELLFKRLVNSIRSETGLNKLQSMFTQFDGKFGNADKIMTEGLEKITMEVNCQKPKLEAIEKWLDGMSEHISMK